MKPEVAHIRSLDTATRAMGRQAGEALRLLELDPDLGAEIAPEERDLAVRHAVARVITVERGPWEFHPLDPGGLGALILDGMIVVRLDFGGLRGHIELLGEGDFISPWVGIGTEVTATCVVSANVVSKLQTALVDRAFALRTARWPEIHAALMQRLLVRSRILSMQSAINSIPRIEERLEITLWQLGYRFGRVTPEGILLDLPITHSQLAEIVSAQRPSVTIALTRLREQGNVVLTERHRWLLRGEPPPRLAAAKISPRG